LGTDALFTLPLTEFIAARNALSLKLRKAGNNAEADGVKALAKPSVSAWAVNQLYWKHRKEFDRLVVAGQDIRQAQAAQLAGRAADTRKASEARQSAISDLLRLAATLLQDGGHSPSSDIMRRVNTTLEAISAYATMPEGVSPGRLTGDLEAPGFDALAALFSGPVPKRDKDDRKEKDTRRADIAAAKTALRQAEQELTKVEARARESVSELKSATTDLAKAEKKMHEAEDRYQAASLAAEEAKKDLEQARHSVEQRSRQLEILNPDSSE
jgi:hypothetical protein